MKSYMIINPFDKLYYADCAWVSFDSQEEAPVLFASRKEAQSFLAKREYYLAKYCVSSVCDRWDMAKVVDVDVNFIE